MKKSPNKNHNYSSKQNINPFFPNLNRQFVRLLQYQPSRNLLDLDKLFL